MKKLSRILLFIFISLTSISCMDDIDDVLSEENDIDQSNLFIYRALNFWYLYKSKTPELANDYFTYQSEFDVFASSFQTPEAMFDYLLYDKDRFSVLTEDYTILERALQGRNKSTGAVFVSFRFQNKIYLLVRNIISNSDAADKNVVRGNIFYKVNGEEITQNNINELLDAPSLELAKAYFDRDEIIETEETVQLLNTDLDEPSIAMYSILEIEGKKLDISYTIALSLNMIEN